MKVWTLAVFAGVAALCAMPGQGQQTPTSEANSTLSSNGAGTSSGAGSSNGAGTSTGAGSSNNAGSPPAATSGGAPGAAPSVNVGPDQVRPPDAESHPAATPPAQSSEKAPSEPVPNPNSPKGPKQARGKGPSSGTNSTGPPPPTTPYIVGTLDVLEIRVWNDPKLSGIYTVRPDGIISLPLIGEFPADGLTVPALTELVKKKLETVMNDPEVNIQVAKINSKRVFIFGGVGRTGEMPIYENMTVLDALSNVGFKDFANTKKIRIMRGTQTFMFNYKDVSRGRNMEQNIYLQNGDRIFVPE
jgi:polysaccharide export outer membrane protein